MAMTEDSLGMDIGHGAEKAKRKRKAPAKKKMTGSEEMDAPSLMKAMAKLHKGSKKATKKKTVKKHHKKKASD